MKTVLLDIAVYSKTGSVSTYTKSLGRLTYLEIFLVPAQNNVKRNAVVGYQSLLNFFKCEMKFGFTSVITFEKHLYIVQKVKKKL